MNRLQAEEMRQAIEDNTPQSVADGSAWTDADRADAESNFDHDLVEEFVSMACDCDGNYSAVHWADLVERARACGKQAMLDQWEIVTERERERLLDELARGIAPEVC